MTEHARAGKQAATASLLLSCRDQPGLVATVADFVYRHGGNILHSDHHIDHEEGAFFQRVEFDLAAFDLARRDIVQAFRRATARFGMRSEIRFSDEVPKLGILVSKQPHCLYDLLTRWRLGELRAEVPLVVSNHPDHEDLVRFMGPAFHHLPVEQAQKAAQEEAVLELLAAHGVDLVVLARYMQVLSPAAVARYPSRIVNIHHSFLPAFLGARPYHQAHRRGVKLIGATAHYATEDLDEGPIIEQDVVRVTHRDTVDDLVRKGRDLEKLVLARAVRAHIENRVLVYGNKTVVFA